jgi:hypothetical protein
MISGLTEFRNNARRAALTTLVLFLGVPVAAAQERFGLDQLMAMLAEAGPVQARYTERRDSPLLAEPVELLGRIVIDPAGRFVKTTDGGDGATIRMEDDVVEMVRGGETRRVSLDSHPMMQLLVDGLFALTRGGTPALEGRFETRLEGEARDWRLTLEPRVEVDMDDPSASEPTGLVRLVIHGEGGGFRRMVLEQSAGQRTVMTFRPVEAQ